MRDMRAECKIGSEAWCRPEEVRVKGDPSLGDDRSQWLVAILGVDLPDNHFRVGWRTPSQDMPPEFLDWPIETTDGGLFGMRVGPGDVCFLALAEDIRTRLGFRLVKVTTQDDNEYEDLPLY